MSDDPDWRVHHSGWIIKDKIPEDGPRLIDYRKELVYRAGTKQNPQHRLRKSTLNSLAAMLTGEFPSVPGLLFMRESPSRIEICEIIADECGLDEWDDDRVHFRKAELATILETINERGDQRPMTGR